MDTVRCLCPAARCPLHGHSPKDPQIDWKLTDDDRKSLRDWRIVDPDDIERVRQAEEDRFKP